VKVGDSGHANMHNEIISRLNELTERGV
jgi:hypothetical protein